MSALPDLFEERLGFLAVDVMRHADGSDDVVVRLDGTYAPEWEEAVPAHWRRDLLDALRAEGFHASRLDGWTGWPERNRERGE